MRNTFVEQRLEGVLNMLLAASSSCGVMSSATMGWDRELFVKHYLSQALPSTFRIGSGDITDSFGTKSGQVDIVVEGPLSPNVSGLLGSSLYLAEGVVAAIEVKSNLAKQWDEVLATATGVKALKRNWSGSATIPVEPVKVPFYVVGYTGWKLDTLRKHLKDAGGKVDGILSLKPGGFIGGISVSGPLCLWALLAKLHRHSHELSCREVDIANYAKD